MVRSILYKWYYNYRSGTDCMVPFILPFIIQFMAGTLNGTIRGARIHNRSGTNVNYSGTIIEQQTVLDSRLSSKI